jgi:hypothetical protein
MAKFIWQDGVLVSKAKVEVDGTIYEVDPEEYSGTTPLSASNLNAMVDQTYEDLKDYVDEKQTYSTTETVIGTWLGKPLYRKVIQYTKTTNTEENLTLSDYGITNVDNIWLNQNSFIKTNNNEYKAVNNYESSSFNTFCNFPSSTSFRLSSNSSYARGTWNLIIEYTKTTD